MVIAMSLTMMSMMSTMIVTVMVMYLIVVTIMEIKILFAGVTQDGFDDGNS